MIKVYTQSTHMKIFYDEATEKEKAASEKILTTKFKAEDSTLKFSYAVKKGWSSAVKSFYVEDKNLLLVGFLPFLEHYYNEAGLKYEIIDLRKYPKYDKDFLVELAKEGFKTPNGFLPRDYQIKSILKIVKNKGGIVQLSMGSGKSLIAYLITQVYKTSKILFLFDAVSLVHQTHKMFVEYGLSPEEIGVIQGQNFQDDRRITLLSVDSFEKAYHIFPEIKVIVADECHGIGSGGGDEVATRILLSCQNAPIRIGLSATADAIDNPYRQMALYGNLGPIIFDKQIKEQVDEGVLAEIEIEMHEVNGDPIAVIGSYADIYETQLLNKTFMKKHNTDDVDKIIAQYEKKGWEKYYDSEKKQFGVRRFVSNGDETNHYVINDARNTKIAEIAKKHDRVLILFVRQEHGERLKELLPDATLVMGKNDAKEREEAIQFLKEHESNIVIASTIFGQGVDIPWVKTLILAGGGKGTVPVIQRFGRITRKDKHTQKTAGKVIDFYDAYSPLGIKQSNRRKAIYEQKLGFKVNIIK